MKAYILQTGRIIPPLNDPPEKARILNLTLGEIQELLFSKKGLEVKKINSLEEVGGEECVVIKDHCYLSEPLFDQFFKKAVSEAKSCVLALTANRFTDLTYHLQDTVKQQDLVIYDCYYLKNGWQNGMALEELPPLAIEGKEFVFKLELPRHFLGQETVEIPITPFRAFHIKHWIHIIRANYYGTFGTIIEWIARKKILPLWWIIKSRSFNKWKILSKAVKKGKKCDIHPSAIIEASQIGDKVKIGANAIVRGCIIDDEVIINERALVQFSVMGRRSLAHGNTTILGSTIYPEAIAGFPAVQFSLLGECTNMAGGIWLVDFKIEGEVEVMHEGKLVPSGTKYLGSCIGHRCFLGTGIYINSGREIPNDTTIIRSADEILNKIPGSLPKKGLFTIKNGTLTPIERKDIPDAGI